MPNHRAWRVWVAKFNYFSGGNIAYYDKRNQNRAPDYHRLDLSLTFGFDNEKKWLAGNFVLSVYNLYGRKNAFSVLHLQVRQDRKLHFINFFALNDAAVERRRIKNGTPFRQRCSSPRQRIPPQQRHRERLPAPSPSLATTGGFP